MLSHYCAVLAVKEARPAEADPAGLPGATSTDGAPLILASLRLHATICG